MHRRRALQFIGALAGLPALPVLGRFTESELLALGARIHDQLEGEPHQPRALTPAQLRLVEIAAEQIIPRTHTPGATDARVADFIDTMLADWYTGGRRARARRWRPRRAPADRRPSTPFGRWRPSET